MSYYFDMDGTLSIYDSTMVDKNMDYKDRPINQLGVHYYRSLQPDPRMQAVLLYLTLNKERVYVISHSVDDLLLATEHLHDKQVWLQEHYSFLRAEQILWIPCHSITKPEAVAIMCNHTITKDDFLIDDYNTNLNDWDSSGGIALKYLNQCNSPDSFNGIQIKQNMSISDIITLLTKLDMKV